MRSGDSGWVFAHPSMVDAYADLLRSPELLNHLILGFPLDVLLGEITCGDVGIQGAVVVPVSGFEAVLDRLGEPLGVGEAAWTARRRRTTFLTTRCDRRFLSMWVGVNEERLSALSHPGLMLDADPDNELVARLHEFGLLPEVQRSTFAQELVEWCLDATDPSLLWNERLLSILSDSERAGLLDRVQSEMLDDPGEIVWNHTQDWSSSNGSPEEAVQLLREMVFNLPAVFPGDHEVSAKARRLEASIDDWVSDQEWDGPKEAAARTQ